MMKEKQMKLIRFNTEMVQAILAGSKTQTRRAIKPQPVLPLPIGWGISDTGPKRNTRVGQFAWSLDEHFSELEFAKPRYTIGDVLYVRETWNTITKGIGFSAYQEYVYKADEGDFSGNKWKPSIHMPKKAARIFLRVTDVRVERLQNITENGARHEGLHPTPLDCDACNYVKCGGYNPNYHPSFPPCVATRHTAKQAFVESLYSVRECGWNANPWVWVIEFERCEK